MRLLHLPILLILGLYAIPDNTQFRVLPGEVDSDGLPTTPARICLGATGTAHCYVPPDYMKGSPFGLDPKAQTVGSLKGENLIFFTAIFSGGGSGELTNLALLTVENGEFVNLLPKVQLTNQSESKIWRLPQFSSLPLLATANFVWDMKAAQASNFQEETHFASHRYAIRAFLFDATVGHYIQKVSYTTTRKYPGLDEVDEIQVLDAEKPKILAELKSGTSL